MGVKNRERRKAKQRARQRDRDRRQEQPGASTSEGFDPAGAEGADPTFEEIFGVRQRTAPRTAQRTTQVVEALVEEAIHALFHRDAGDVAECRDALVEGNGRPGNQREVDVALSALLRRSLSQVWLRGWQPADVVRVARRDYGARHARVVVDVIAAEICGYAEATIDEHWQEQVRDAGATVWWGQEDEYLPALAEREGLARSDLMQCVLEVLFILNTCPEMPMLCAPPGQGRRGVLNAAVAGSREVNARQLDRIRALLAKAESTTFPEEAEAYTAKAQGLMARHSIDYALLSLGSGFREEPTGRRIGVDNPYEAPKVVLLDAVARANRCTATWSKAFGFVTVLGFPSDADAVELLFTSLLVQATSAMMWAGSRRDVYGRSSTRSFRQSFLTAYAQRIDERLATATKDATEEVSRSMVAESGVDRLLPVLASRESEVRQKTAEYFPSVTGRSVSITNRAGWESGRAAADQANLQTRSAVAGQSG